MNVKGLSTIPFLPSLWGERSDLVPCFEVENKSLKETLWSTFSWAGVSIAADCAKWHTKEHKHFREGRFEQFRGECNTVTSWFKKKKDVANARLILFFFKDEEEGRELWSALLAPDLTPMVDKSQFQHNGSTNESNSLLTLYLFVSRYIRKLKALHESHRKALKKQTQTLHNCDCSQHLPLCLSPWCLHYISPNFVSLYILIHFYWSQKNS